MLKSSGAAGDSITPLGSSSPLIEPILAEVSADVALVGRFFRHPVRFVRMRPELEPADLLPRTQAS